MTADNPFTFAFLLSFNALFFCFFFFFNDTATTEIYTLSLHDALPICRSTPRPPRHRDRREACGPRPSRRGRSCPLRDRKSTRLNSSHGYISYAVFCLKKKKTKKNRDEESYRTLRNKH